MRISASTTKEAAHRRPLISSPPTSTADGWRALARLAISPFSLARAARRSSAAQATVAMIFMYVLGVVLPLATIGGAANEPHRDLTWYAREIISCIPRIILWSSPLLALFLFLLAIPARLAEKNGRIRLAAELRVMMLAPFALVIPACVWCVMFAGWQTNKPGFNLFWYEQNGITPWTRNPFVVFLGSGRWWLMVPIAALLLALHALRSYRGMPRFDGLSYCRECFYLLIGRDSGVCPECGLPFGDENDQSSSEPGISRRE